MHEWIAVLLGLILASQRAAHADPAAATPPASVGAPAAAAGSQVCAPMPAPVVDQSIVKLDVDGDGVADSLIPTECEARGNCKLDVYLTRKPCPLAFGSIQGEPRTLPKLKQPFLPLRSHGQRMIWTEESVHHATIDAVWAWNGNDWANVFNAYNYFEVRGNQKREELDLSVPATIGSVCVDKQPVAASFELDGDGHADVAYRVPCGQPDAVRHGCGLWILTGPDSCRTPVAVLPDGRVELAKPASADGPGVLRVRRGKAATEYRFKPADPTADPPWTHLQLVETRACSAGQPCGAWEAVTPAAGMQYH